jgi:Protein of unknown function (DUF1585)/Protein of unknown function (DUF1588)
MQDLKPDLTWIGGLENQQRRRSTGDHAIGAAALLTARFPVANQTTMSMSVDQIIGDAQHRTSPACSVCHNLMDPIGFGLENYDGIGAYRSMDSGVAIDSSGKLPDGTTFNGAVELAGILAKDVRMPACVTEKFMTFGIGRLMNQPDDPQWISYLSAAAQGTDGSLRSVIRAVLLSDAFRSRMAGSLM